MAVDLGKEDGLEVPEVGTEAYRAALRESLRRKKKPSTVQTYDTSEAFLWEHRHLPPGSVIVYKASDAGSEANEDVALYVNSYTSTVDGIWLGVSVLGAPVDEVKKEAQNYFRSGRRYVHICLPDGAGLCPMAEELGLHLTTFTWYPPGEFTAPWLNAYARRKVKDGPKAAAEAAEAAAAGAGAVAPRAGREELSDTERRLEELKRKGGRVSFLEPPVQHDQPRHPGHDWDGSPVGILKKARRSSSVPATRLAIADKVKKETVDLVSDTESASKKDRGPRIKKKRSDALAVAAASHRLEVLKKEQGSDSERGRSRRKKKKKKRKKRRHSSSQSSSESSGSTSSSLLPPLKRKSQRRPGSVLRMLEHQAFDFLQQDGVIGDQEEDGEGARRPKLYTYFQLALRPNLDPKSRDAKELALLCKGLDLLRAGDLEVLADHLAARLIAVETATRQGWNTARHLEIHTGEDEGTAPAHLLLAAQKHGKQVERAGGKGSYSRASQWHGEWPQDSRPKGKGKEKGKGKKGKNKGKGGKTWQTWGAGTPKDAEVKPPGEPGK